MWTKISEKQYRVEIAGELVDIKVPHAKTELLFTTFINKGGVMDSSGKVLTDPITLITSFREVADILLTKYGAKGAVLEEGDSSELSTTEITELFEVATDCVENFLRVVAEMSEKKELAVAAEEKTSKAKKTKA